MKSNARDETPRRPNSVSSPFTFEQFNERLKTHLRKELSKAMLEPRIEEIRKQSYRRMLRDDLAKRKN